MRKIIKLKIENTNRIRTTEDTYCEIYSHDKNNGLFEFEIINEYLEVENPKAVFKFTNSNKVWQTTGTVVDGRIKVKFDTTLITHDEIVVCWLYLDEEQRSSDAYRFKFKVKLSEIDKVDGYETKERFIKDTLIVDRLDVMTREDLDRAIKDIQTGAFSKEGLLTEAKAEETYAKKSEAVDNTNFELVKNRVLALELKTDKDTVYDDSELKGRVSVLEAKQDNDTVYDDTNVRERLTALESKPNVDVNNLVTKDELASKNYLTEHQNLDEYAKKSEIPQQYNDTEVKERLTTLENKAPVDLSNLATKQELNEIRNSQPTVDTSNLVTRDELTAKNYVTDEVLESKGYLKSHQNLDNLVTKQELEEKHFLTDQALNNYALKSELYNDTDLKSRVEVLEQKTDKDTVYDDTPLKERVTALESKAIEGGAYDDSDLRNRVVALESKEDKDTKYDDTDLRNRVTNLENKSPLDTSEFVTNQTLESKGYIKDVSNLVTKDELEGKHYISDISNLVTKEELESKGYLKTHQNLDNVVTKEELATKGYISDVSNLVTKEELESKNYLTTPYNDAPLKERVEVLETKVDKDTVYNDEPIKERLTALETKVDKDTVYNDSELRNRVEVLENKPNVDLSNYVTNEQLENKHYLTQHQELTHLATTSDLEVLRNISVNKAELSKKVDTTEFNSFKDSVVTKSELAEKGYLTETTASETYAKKSELPTPYNDSALVSRVQALESKPASQYEIHGTGMPNGVVEAEIGTTYIDKNKTNGAFKWIKTTNGGNQGWEVLTGDTGWRTLNSVSKLGNSFVKVRRVNNEVTYQFGGLSWGWFGIVRRGGAGYVMQTTDTERNCFILGEHGIPAGFRAPNSLIGSIYNDRGVTYGTWYVGNGGDANHLRFQFLNPVPTDSDIGDIRVSRISYLTDDQWPTQLP